MKSALQSRHGSAGRAIAAALVSAAMLCGCSTYALIDNMPAAVGGLPEGVPERPASPAAYPSVNDRPPAREDAPLSEAEKKRLQDELIATRTRAARQSGNAEVISTSAGAARN